MNVIYANLGAAAAAIIVLLLRRVLKKKVPPAVFAALWLLVLIRVLIPVEVATHISVFSAESAPAASANGEFEHGEGTTDFVMPQFGAQTDEEPQSGAQSGAQAAGEAQNGAQYGAQAEIQAQSVSKMTAARALSLVHIGGAVLLALYFGFGHAVMLRRCKGFEHEKNAAANEILRGFDKHGRIALLVSTDACSPFSVGIIKPKIVLPPDCKEEQLRFILAHEYVHIRDHDAAARLVGLAAVCAGWFNPFVWLAFVFLDRDLERFCDERALRLLGAENAPRYALTLLDFAERQMQSAAAQSFAAAPLEERVNDILNIKKRKISTLAAVVLVAAALLGMTACGTASYAAEVSPEEGKTLFCMERYIFDGDENDFVIKFENSDGGESAEPEEIISAEADFTAAEKLLAEGKIQSSKESLYNGAFVSPTDTKADKLSESISAEFGRTVRNADGTFVHNGIDIVLPEGSSVYAANDGKIAYVGGSSADGYTVIIDHGKGIFSLYSGIFGFENNDSVKKGDLLGTVSAKAKNSTGCHLHFSIFKGSAFVDPLSVIAANDDSGTIKVDASTLAERTAYRTYDRKWDFYDIFTSDYARPTKDASSVMWDGCGYVLIDGTKGEDIFATKSGTVKDFDFAGGYGLVLIVEHDDGTAVIYCHLDEVLVNIGDRVEQGDVIATLGSSGNTKTPVCGFEIIENGVTPLHTERALENLDEIVSKLRKNETN